ncbi:hypothetical protein [Clostridium thermobutyricum]|uniref:hypothetical protein n=1 Tax=Clostridium thermobutyricum TaxID=29372 RepID=UPI0029424C63|nr:hypothetical protein [Clostridium thermobutyricum]
MKKISKKRNGWKCKGYTLLETSIYLGLTTLLFCILTKCIISTSIETKSIYSNSMKINSIESGIYNIKDYLNGYSNLYFEENQNKLVIFKKDDSAKSPLKDEIYFFERKLFLKYYRRENGNLKTYSSLIMDNIDDFRIIKKDNLLYLIIKSGGIERYVCV